MKTVEFKVGKSVMLIDEQDVALARSFYLKAQKLRHSTYCVLYKRVDKKTVYAGLLHRLILNAPDGMVVDHIDGNGLNNCRSNLRLTTNSENICSRHSTILKPSTGFFGVYQHRDAFTWEFTVNRKRTRKGGFKSALEAAIDRERALETAAHVYARSNKERIAESQI